MPERPPTRQPRIDPDTCADKPPYLLCLISNPPSMSLPAGLPCLSRFAPTVTSLCNALPRTMLVRSRGKVPSGTSPVIDTIGSQVNDAACPLAVLVVVACATADSYDDAVSTGYSICPWGGCAAGLSSCRWYRKAAEQGDERAQYNLGPMYANGQGVPQDFIRAYMWSHPAVATSSGSGAIELKKLQGDVTSRLTPSQIEQVQEMARRSQDTKFKECS